MGGVATAAITVGVVIAIILAGRFGAQPVLRMIARSGMREIFTAAALALVVGVTLLMQAVNLSPALGAFLVGVVLADNEFRHEIEADIEPFRGLLLGLFFIAVGTSLDFALIVTEWLLVASIVASIVLAKGALLYGLCRLAGRGRADSLLVGLGLAQGGEFAFVLFAFAEETAS